MLGLRRDLRRFWNLLRRLLRRRRRQRSHLQAGQRARRSNPRVPRTRRQDHPILRSQEFPWARASDPRLAIVLGCPEWMFQPGYQCDDAAHRIQLHHVLLRWVCRYSEPLPDLRIAAYLAKHYHFAFTHRCLAYHDRLFQSPHSGHSQFRSWACCKHRRQNCMKKYNHRQTQKSVWEMYTKTVSGI